MRAHEEYRAIAVERILSTIPVMHIPIGDHYFSEAVLALRVASSNRNVIENAKAHALRRPGMMSRRPHRAKGIGGCAGNNCIDCIQNASNSAHRDLKGSPADVGIPGAQF